MVLWLKPDKLLDNKFKVNSEITFKLTTKIFTTMNLSNGIKLQIMESLTHTQSIEKVTLATDSNSEDGLIHLAGLILVLMMIKYLLNLMFLRDQLKPIMEKTSQELLPEKHGTGMELVLIKQNFQDGLIHFHGLMKEKVMREYSKEKLSMLMPKLKMPSDYQKRLFSVKIFKLEINICKMFILLFHFYQMK